MTRYEYMLIPVTMTPPNIMEKYTLHDLVHNIMVLGEIRKGMYGLAQAGQLAYDKLVQHLSRGDTSQQHTRLASSAIKHVLSYFV